MLPVELTVILIIFGVIGIDFADMIKTGMCVCIKALKVIVTQNKGKGSENSYRKLKSSWWTGTRKQNLNISTDTAVLLNQKRANVCEHTTRMAS